MAQEAYFTNLFGIRWLLSGTRQQLVPLKPCYLAQVEHLRHLNFIKKN